MTDPQPPPVARPTQEREPGDGLRRVLRILYLPWTVLVFVPAVAVLTAFWGGSAVVIAGLGSPRLAFYCGVAWARMLCWINFTWVRIEGKENAQRGRSYVMISNHQSHFDILAFYGHWVRQFRWVMKIELRRVPFLGPSTALIGNIFIDRSNREKAIESLRKAKPLLAGGISIMIFPEGTRSRDGHMKEFKKGGFVVAQDLGLPILPVSISFSRHVLPGKQLGLLPGFIRIRFHPPIDPNPYAEEGRERLMHDVREAIKSGLTPWERGEG